MNLFDLFEGAIDDLEARRIQDLEAKMDDLSARAKATDDPKVKLALRHEFAKCKAERDSYYKLNLDEADRDAEKTIRSVMSQVFVDGGGGNLSYMIELKAPTMTKLREKYHDDLDAMLTQASPKELAQAAQELKAMTDKVEEDVDTNYTYTVFIDGTKEGTYGSKEEAKVVVKRKKEQAPGREYTIRPKSRTSMSSIKKFQRNRDRNIDEDDLVTAEGFALTAPADQPPMDPAKKWKIIVRQLISDYIKNPQGLSILAKQKGPNSAEMAAYNQIMHPTGKIALPPNAVTFEGFQDFNKVEPYEVCIAGKPIKNGQHDYYEEARRHRDNLKNKWRKQGRSEKEIDTITINPVMKEQGVAEAGDRVDPILIKALNRMPDGLVTHGEVLDACYDAYAMELGRMAMKSNYGTTNAYIPQLMDLYKQKHSLDIKEDTGSWIVYDPASKQIKKRFKTHTAGKSYAKVHGLGFASSEYYFDNVKDQQSMAEDEQIDGMARGEVKEIIRNASTIQQALDQGVSLDGWMYSYVTTSNDHLNSVAEQIGNPDIEEAGMDWAAHKSTGPKFSGYLKGTDPAPTEFGNKSVGGMEEGIDGNMTARSNPLTQSLRKRQHMNKNTQVSLGKHNNNLKAAAARKLGESINLTESRTYKLWESAGRKIYEAQLTADQIQQLFQQAEQGATTAGGNRTLVGQGKDVATAVNKAWEDLKTKVQNSGPIKDVDNAYDQAAEKLKQATGGDQGVMQYVQKYRTFAKAHPIAQGIIYSALIAAAGISGAGLGGAAALGLFKMVDKLLQGEKFSSAAYSGAKTGAMAYGAGQIGKALQGGEKVTSTTTTDTGVVDMPGDPALNQAMASGQQAASGFGRTTLSTFQNDPYYGKQLATIIGDKQYDPGWIQEFTKQLGKQAANPSDPRSMGRAWSEASRIASAFAGNAYGPLKESHYIDRNLTVYTWMLNESIGLPKGGVQLTNEGIGDMFKKAAGAVGNWAQTKGHNLTTRVTADKLQSAWQKAGSPTDSDEVAQILQQAGVSPDVVKQIYTGMKIPAPMSMNIRGADGSNNTVQMKNNVIELTKDDPAPAGHVKFKDKNSERYVAIPQEYQQKWEQSGVWQLADQPAQANTPVAGAMKTNPARTTAPAQTTAQPTPAVKPHTGGRVAGQVSQTPNAIRQRQQRAAQKQQPAQARTQPATGGAGAFNNMAGQLGTNGTTTRTSSGLVHRAAANNPNQQYAEDMEEGWKNTVAGAALAGAAALGAGGAHAGGVSTTGQGFSMDDQLALNQQMQQRQQQQYDQAQQQKPQAPQAQKDLSAFGTEYLQKVVDGQGGRAMVSVADAKAELAARANGTSQQAPAPVKAPDSNNGQYKSLGDYYKANPGIRESSDNFLTWAVRNGYNFTKDPAIYESARKEYQSLVESKKKTLKEAKGLGKRVRVVSGPASGQTGTIGEVRNGAYQGAPKYYTVDLDNGGHVQVRKEALKLIKSEIDESLKDNEYFVWTVYFDDGTSKRIKVKSDEFDPYAYYARKNQVVVNVDYDWSIHQ